MIKPLWTVIANAQGVAQAAVQYILATAKTAIAQRGEFRLVLAGGSTPLMAYAQLASEAAEWHRWQIYFGDERCLPAHDTQRNSVMAARVWLDHVPIPAQRVHVIPAELGAREAAEKYSAVVGDAVPFDLVLLGLGEDGHTASLFPGQHPDQDLLVCPVFSAPKPPPQRVTLTFKALNNSWHTLVLVTGKEKRDAVHGWQGGQTLPILQVTAKEDYQVFADRTATGS